MQYPLYWLSLIFPVGLTLLYLSDNRQKQISYISQITCHFDNQNNKTIQSEIQVVKSKNSTKNWKIIGFTDIKYLPVAKIWYQHLNNLGYDNHYLVSLDNQTADYFSRQQTTKTKKLVYRNFASKQEILPVTMNDRGRFLKSIWKTRLLTILDLLRHERQPVLLSDVDSIFLRYKNLQNFPSEYDIFAAIATSHPLDVYRLWGTTLGGGIIGFQANERTIKFLEQILNKCPSYCDDQAIFNRILAFDYKIKFYQPPGMLNLVGEGEYENNYLKILVFNNQTVTRVSDLPEMISQCKNSLDAVEFNRTTEKDLAVAPGILANLQDVRWIINPMAPKSAMVKVQLYQQFKPCFRRSNQNHYLRRVELGMED